MPQVDIFLSEQDVEEIVGYVFEHGCRIAADINYKDPVPGFVYSVEEFRELRGKQKPTLFFILSDKWQRTSLVLKPLIKNEDRFYYIQQKSGGPTIDLFAPFEYKSESGVYLPHGFLSFHSKYWNQATKENEPAPSELKSFFRELKKDVFTEADLVTGKNRKYMVACGAKKRLTETVKLGAPIK